MALLLCHIECCIHARKHKYGVREPRRSRPHRYSYYLHPLEPPFYTPLQWYISLYYLFPRVLIPVQASLVTGRFYGLDAGRSARVDVAVNQTTGTAWVGTHLGAGARRSTVFFRTARGHHRLVVFCTHRPSGDTNSAVYDATGRSFKGEFLVLASAADNAGTKFSQIRTAWHAHFAVDLVIRAINQRGRFPRVVIHDEL
ncbi:hypothetical protein AURDEDRAFT_178495 [Auricularia subglabra TFB-10046 SS5]|uniref:Uncharacterized protein n=1 Tax=Auricularia subglabra (strain TFB-10046 / SS5) TaxID=717982 RepID=J0D1I9_AURST|nr:hypothetical protein AURDEDRAFT_178495 [Auricularia subglabra TFB-10046 SS5]